MRERKWQTRETLARGIYPPYTPLHTNGKEINGTKRNIEGPHSSLNAVLTLRMEVFLFSMDPDLATGSFKYTP